MDIEEAEYLEEKERLVKELASAHAGGSLGKIHTEIKPKDSETPSPHA